MNNTGAGTQLGRIDPQRRVESSTKNRRVLIIQSMCKQYRQPLYVELAKKLEAERVHLRVVYSAPSGTHRSRLDDVDLSSEVGKNIRGKWLFQERLLLQLPIKEVLRADLIIVEHALKHLINYPLMALSALRLRKLAFWVHGGSLREQSMKPGYLSHRAVLSCSDWQFAYTRGVRDLLVSRGKNSRRITVLQNATDLSSFRRALASVSSEELRQCQDSLGIPSGSNVAIFCGSLYDRDQLHFILKTAQAVRVKNGKFHLLVIGSGPKTSELQTRIAGVDWIHYLGPIFGDERARYFRLADMCLMPYLTGLGILDAMAAGLPYLVTGQRATNPEIEYLVPGVTGLVTGNDPYVFAEAVLGLFADKTRLWSMSGAAFRESHQYSIEHMADNFAHGILSCLGGSA